MNEFVNNIDQFNPIGTFVCLVAFLVLVGITSPALIESKKIRFNKIKWIYLVILLFCIFAFFGGDWFHYRDIIERLSRKKLEISELEDVSTQNHLEIVYWYISYFVQYNYLLFRIVVFGGALYFLRKAIIMLRINQSIFLALFVACALLSFSISRVCIAQSLSLLGAVLIYRASFTRRKLLRNYIFGLFLIGISFFFHKSILFMIICVFLSMIPMYKSSIIIMIIAFPFLVFFIQENFTDIIMSQDLSEESYLNYTSMQSYAMRSKTYGIGTTILVYLNRIFWYSIYAFCIYIISGPKRKLIPTPIRKCAMLTFWIISLATIFVTQNQTIYNRLLSYSNIAALPVLSYCYYNKVNEKYISPIYYLGILSGIYSLVIMFLGKALLH